MGTISKGFSLLLGVILAVSSLIMVESTSAQSIPKPSVPEFTVKYVDNSYDVPPKTTSSTDPYTGKVISTTIPGYHVQNKSVELIIKNQPFTSYLNENGARVWLFYYVAAKGHFENWSTIDANYWLKQKLSESYPPGFIDISDTQYTVITLGFGGNNGTDNAHYNDYRLGNVSDGGQVDFRAQAIIGYSTRINTTFSGPPIGLEPGESYHYYIFTGQISDWSNIQTLSIPDGSVSTSTPSSTSPTTPTPTALTPTSTPTADPNGNSADSITLPLNVFIVIIAVLALALVALSVLAIRRHRKPRFVE